MTRSGRVLVAVGIALASALMATAACVGDDPDASSSSSSSSSGNGSSGTTTSSGGSSGETSSSGGSSSGDSGADATPPPLTGKVDSTFKNGGRTDVSLQEVYGVAVDASSRVYVVGTVIGCISGAGDRDFAVARYLANGDLDTNFGTSGRACIDLGGASDFAQSVAFDAMNRIVVAGTAGAINTQMGIGRLNENGTLDTQFAAPNGWLKLGATDSRGRTVIVDGASIYFAGTLATGSKPYPHDAAGGLLARITSFGVLDSTFGGVKQDADARWFGALAVYGGFVYAAGSSVASPARAIVVRYSSAGVRDATWGAPTVPSGSASFDVATGLTVLADGRVVLTGASNQQPWSINTVFYRPLFAARFGTAAPGTADTTFNAGGAYPASAVTTNLFSNSDDYGAGAVDVDGRPIVAGIYGPDGGADDPALARFKTDGTPDLSFGDAGIVRANAIAAQMKVIGAARDPSTGKVVVLSSTNRNGNSFALYRFE